MCSERILQPRGCVFWKEGSSVSVFSSEIALKMLFLALSQDSVAGPHWGACLVCEYYRKELPWEDHTESTLTNGHSPSLNRVSTNGIILVPACFVLQDSIVSLDFDTAHFRRKAMSACCLLREVGMSSLPPSNCSVE